jgi:bacterioferritin-associated ferredoxin
MIVCVCNELNGARVEAAISAGAKTADQVYKACGVERKCGRCQETINVMIEEALQKHRLQAA